MDTISQEKTQLLFVDDEPAFLELATLFLERSGRFEVTACSSATEALSELSKRSYDAIIADYEMPDMNGIELLRTVRIQNENIPFILFTGRSREEVAIEALNYWADFYLEKGADPKSRFSELSEKILTAIERRKFQEELSSSHEKLMKAYEQLTLREQDLVRQNHEFIKKQRELELSEHRWRELFQSMKEGVILHQMIYGTDTNPVDYRIIDANQAVEEHIGMSIQSAIGQRGSVFYGMDPAPYLDVYAKVAQTGDPVSFETFFPPYNRFFTISAFSPRKGYFATVFSDITMRKQAEEKIREMNEVLSQAQEIAHLGSWTYDMKTGTIRCSDEIFRIFGYEIGKEEITIDKLRLCIHPGDSAAFDSMLRTPPGSESSGEQVFRLLRPDGVIRYIAALRKEEIGEDGVISRLIGIIQDVTGKKEAEQQLVAANTELSEKNEELAASYEEIAASEEEIRSQMEELSLAQMKLKQSQQHLMLAQRVGKTGSFEIIPQTGEITGSEVFFDLYGIPYTPPGTISFDIFRACTPSFEMLNQEMVLLITEGKPYLHEYLIHPADNSGPRVVRSAARVIHTPDGTVDRIVGVIHDVTDERNALIHLQETKEYLETLISHANAPILVWNPSLEITECNHAAEILTGLLRHEVITKKITDLFPEASRVQSLSRIEGMMTGEQWESIRLPIQRPDGSVRTLIWNAALIRDSQGTLVSILGTGIDITDQETLKEEKKVALELIERNLAELAVLNDGIRNPLNVILTHMDLKEPGYEERISREIARIDSMIAQLDKRWAESEKILSYLRKHYRITFDSQV